MGLSYNKETAIGKPIQTELEDGTAFLNNNNIVGRESDIQTEPFIHRFSNPAFATDYFELTRPIILTSVLGLGAQYVCGINSSSNQFLDGNTARDIKIPNWFLEAGTLLYSQVNGSTVQWIGYYAD